MTLENTGEDSYLTSLNMTLPDDVSYVNVVDVDSCIPIACQQVSHNMIHTSAGDKFLSFHNYDRVVLYGTL